MNRLRGAAAGAAYVSCFLALAIASARTLGTHGACQDVYFALHHVEARTSAGASLPVPVIQMCSNHTTAALLVVLAIAASAAWAAVRRWMPRAPLAALFALGGLCACIAFPYVASTDPYAYALYGYEAAHGQTPYAAHEGTAAAHSPSLDALYRLFPAGSTDRVANYGPAAVFEYQAVALLAGDSLHGYVIALRVVHACLLLVLAWLLSLLRAPSVSRTQAAWTAFHPLLLLESIAFGHGDLLMIVLLCAAFAAYRRHAIALCVLLVVAAAEVRMAAGLALVVLLLELNRREGVRACAKAALVSLAAFGATAAASVAAYGHFTLGGAPAIEAYSSPMMLAFNAAAVTLGHVKAGLVAQALLGLTIIALALRTKRYALADFGALASLPIARAWYCQWLLPLLALDSDRRIRAAAFTAASVAIAAEWPAMTAHSDAATWAVILSLQWLLPAAAALLCEWKASPRTRAAAAASPST